LFGGSTDLLDLVVCVGFVRLRMSLWFDLDSSVVAVVVVWLVKHFSDSTEINQTSLNRKNRTFPHLTGQSSYDVH